MLIVALALALAVPVLFIRQAPATDDVKIALVAPLSGRWARQGQLKKMGADMAIEEINSQGGIKALGGAKIVLREADAGDSVEKAVSAAQRVLTREKMSACRCRGCRSPTPTASPSAGSSTPSRPHRSRRCRPSRPWTWSPISPRRAI